MDSCLACVVQMAQCGAHGVHRGIPMCAALIKDTFRKMPCSIPVDDISCEEDEQPPYNSPRDTAVVLPIVQLSEWEALNQVRPEDAQVPELQEWPEKGRFVENGGIVKEMASAADFEVRVLIAFCASGGVPPLAHVCTRLCFPRVFQQATQADCPCRKK